MKRVNSSAVYHKPDMKLGSSTVDTQPSAVNCKPVCSFKSFVLNKSDGHPPFPAVPAVPTSSFVSILLLVQVLMSKIYTEMTSYPWLSEMKDLTFLT